MRWSANESHTRQVWSGWRTVFWWLRALHVIDLEWSGSIVRLVWLRRAHTGARTEDAQEAD